MMKLCLREYSKKPRAQVKKIILKQEQKSHYFKSKMSRKKYILVDSRSVLGKIPVQFISMLLINDRDYENRSKREGDQTCQRVAA